MYVHVHEHMYMYMKLVIHVAYMFACTNIVQQGLSDMSTAARIYVHEISVNLGSETAVTHTHTLCVRSNME